MPRLAIRPVLRVFTCEELAKFTMHKAISVTPVIEKFRLDCMFFVQEYTTTPGKSPSLPEPQPSRKVLRKEPSTFV